MSEIVIANMRGRAIHCRSLAAAATDERTVQSLLSMAHEIERDVVRLQGDDVPSRPAEDGETADQR